MVMNFPLTHYTIPPTQTIYSLNVQYIFERFLDKLGYLESNCSGIRSNVKTGGGWRWRDFWISIPTIATMINVIQQIANNESN